MFQGAVQGTASILVSGQGKMRFRVLYITDHLSAAGTEGAYLRLR